MADQNIEHDVSKARLEALLDTAVDGIIVIDSSGSVEAYNPACERLFGYSAHEVMGRNVKMLMPNPYRDEHDQYLANYRATGRKRIIGIGREVLGRRNDGTTFPMYLSVGEGRVSGKSIFVGIIHDVTDRKTAELRMQEMQQELFHVSRLGEMGQMASALAHELNQPLAATANYVNTARRIAARDDHPESALLVELLGKAANQTLRAGQIIRRLREFTEKAASARNEESLNAVVEEAISLGLVGSADTAVTVHKEFAPNLPPIALDRIQIQQVVLNLIRNAIEAMQNSERRELTVRTVIDDDFVQVQVSDTGPGLSPEIVAKLFQPFVTTKQTGMGIGLSICRSIIDAHRGRLWMTPNDGGGVTFRFRLPIASPEDGK